MAEDRHLSMEARQEDELPRGSGWQYEPKWDGFRCLALRDGDAVELLGRSAKSLARYFPEMVQALRSLKAKRFILDGELTIPVGKILSFKEQMRLHLAASLVTKLAAAHPSLLTVFDMLETARGADLTAEPLRVRPAALEKFMAALAPSVFLRLSPAATRRVDADRAAPTKKVKALIGKPGFTGDKPGGPSRWSTERSAQWQPPDEADG